MERIMKSLAGFRGIFLVGFLLINGPFAVSGAATDQDTLKQYLADLQKNSSDQVLREKIIKLVSGMKTKPVVPEEVAKHEGAAEYAFKNAKKESDYADAAAEYEKALLLAPWLANDYFNCGVAYEMAGKPRDAIGYFNLYLIAAPDAKDATEVKKRIGGLEYAAGKAAQEAQAQDKAKADAEAKQRQTKEVLDQFRTIVGGANYESWDSSYRAPERGSYFGVNEEEFKGPNWYYLGPVSARLANIKYCFDEQSVKITSIAGNCASSADIFLVGTPNGPTIKNINFKFTPSPTVEKKWGKDPFQVWAVVNETNGDITYSLDRPVNQADYDPKFRYHYEWFRRH